jgi:hypothetical protein
MFIFFDIIIHEWLKKASHNNTHDHMGWRNAWWKHCKKKQIRISPQFTTNLMICIVAFTAAYAKYRGMYEDTKQQSCKIMTRAGDTCGNIVTPHYWGWGFLRKRCAFLPFTYLIIIATPSPTWLDNCVIPLVYPYVSQLIFASWFSWLSELYHRSPGVIINWT